MLSALFYPSMPSFVSLVYTAIELSPLFPGSRPIVPRQHFSRERFGRERLQGIPLKMPCNLCEAMTTFEFSQCLLGFSRSYRNTIHRTSDNICHWMVFLKVPNLI